MKNFTAITFDPKICNDELIKFKDILDSKDELEEAKDILPFFKNAKHLSLMIGSIYPEIIVPDQSAYEFPIFGDFASDLIVLDSGNKSMLLIEFEDAKENSIFKKNGNKATLEWSQRIEHGLSQIIDWLWKLSDMEKTTDFEIKFGRDVKYQALLIIGRDSFIPIGEKIRLNWRFQKTVVNSVHIQCLTYDQLYEMVKRKLTLHNFD